MLSFGQESFGSQSRTTWLEEERREMASPGAVTFADLLRHYRAAAGLTQEELAEQATLSTRAISDLERGLKTHPRKDTVHLLADALGLGPDDRSQLEAVGRHRVTAMSVRSEASDLSVTLPPVPTHSLPIHLTSFVGREREVGVIRNLLLRPGVCLVTLTGPGGIGKTRLAVHVAGEVSGAFPDGVVFVPLAPIADPTLVLPTIARTLGLAETPGFSFAQLLTRFLHERVALLVLDNFEHLLPDTPRLVELLGECPGLRMLVTSRETLRLSGEHGFEVLPLTVPVARSGATADEVGRSEAGRLFIERARAVQPSFAVTEESASAIAGICRRLDGLPLAIELAAARVRVLPPQAMLDRMVHSLAFLTGGPRDAPARQQTLRNTIAWSYDLLTAAERVLFRRLAIFRGCNLEVVEAICSDPADQTGSSSIAIPPLQIDTLDGIFSLVEKSLLNQQEMSDGQPRYTMLETVREFSLEKLAESGETDVIQRRHILYYLKLAESAEREAVGAREAMWQIRIGQEHDNLRAALDCCVARGYAGPGYRLALALWWFWMVRGHVSEGRERFASLLARFPLRDPSGHRAAERAKALHAAASLASIQGDSAAARSLQEEGLAISRALADKIGACSALEGLVLMATIQGDYLAARAYAEEFLETARAAGDKRMIGLALQSRANVLHEQGDYAAACALAEESVRVLSDAEDPMVAAAYVTLGVMLQELGDYDAAQSCTEAALVRFRQHGNRREVALVLANLGSIAVARGDMVAANERLRECLVIQQELIDAAGIALVLERFAALAAGQHRHRRAICVAGAAAALREASNSTLPPGSQTKLEQQLSASRQALDATGVAQAWAEGHAMSLEDAISFTLGQEEDTRASLSRHS